MTTENYVLALAAVGDTKDGFQRLCKAIEEIDGQEAESTLKGKYTCKCDPMKQLMSISQAMDAPSQLCILEESVGRISAEFVYLYPPGIPIIVPGEQITGLFTRNVRRYMEQGLNLYGLCGENNEKVSVIKERAE